MIYDSIVNFTLTSTVLYEVDGLDSTLLEIKRIMIQDGKIAIIEWEKVKRGPGPNRTSIRFKYAY